MNRRIPLLFICEIFLRILVHVSAKRIFAVVLLNEETGEVSGKAFAQPQVCPSCFRYRIAEPLMRNLMRDDTLDSGRYTEVRADFFPATQIKKAAGENYRA